MSPDEARSELRAIPSENLRVLRAYAVGDDELSVRNRELIEQELTRRSLEVERDAHQGPDQ
jgi:hypothetical protein